MTVKRYKNSPNKTDVLNLVFEKVRITLFDGSVLEGYLRKTGEKYTKGNNNLNMPKNYYFISPQKTMNKAVENMIFRESHIKAIEWVEKGGKNE